MKKVPLRIHYAQKWPLQNLMTIVGTPKVPMSTLRISEYE